VVHAAGGVVHRRRDDGTVEILLVHRPRYDDWSLPKGKLDAGEEYEAAAVREVEEETGVVTALGPEVAAVRYADAAGRPKVVRYWLMTVLEEHDRPPDHEVDDARWVPIGDAAGLLSYPRDAAVIDRARRLL
jgi:8-oxo-dGTP diphosphatase